MGRDDWMYDEDSLEEAEEESKKGEQAERQCPNCTRFVSADSPYCAWCGRPFPPAKPRREER